MCIRCRALILCQYCADKTRHFSRGVHCWQHTFAIFLDHIWHGSNICLMESKFVKLLNCSFRLLHFLSDGENFLLQSTHLLVNVSLTVILKLGTARSPLLTKFNFSCIEYLHQLHPLVFHALISLVNAILKLFLNFSPPIQFFLCLTFFLLNLFHLFAHTFILLVLLHFANFFLGGGGLLPLSFDLLLEFSHAFCNFDLSWERSETLFGWHDG